MNKLFLLFIAIIPIISSANDLIVDQNSLTQYEADDYLLFDPFGGDTISFCGNIRPPNGSPENCDRVDLGDNGPILGNNFTIELWVYSDSTTDLHREIIGIGGIASETFNGRPPTITYNYNRQIRYGFGGSFIYARYIVDDVRHEKSWDHIAFTFNGARCKLYVNGVVVHSSNSMSGQWPAQIPIRYIGKGLHGKIDEVRIWDIARTQAEIQAAMYDTLSGDEAGLVAYYPMDVNENWELVDYSPNENHATITDVEILSRYFSDNCPAPDGSYDCPYPTIRSAIDDARPGDRVLIRGGRYTELLNKWQLNHSYETEGQKILIEGYPDEDVIIDGTIAINADWEPYNHNGYNIYKAVLNMDSLSSVLQTPIDSILGVFVDGRYMIPAMQTNFKNPTDPTTGNPLNPEPGTVWALGLLSPYDYPDSTDYIPGDLSNLDTLEEWSFDPSNNTLYLYASNDYIPTSTNVRVRVRERFLIFMHSDNIEFRNIHFFAGSFNFYNCSYLTIENCRFSFSSEMGLRGNELIYGTNTIARNCIFEYINERSPWYQQRTMYPVLENCLFRYNDWFASSANYAVTGRNYRGTTAGGDITHGGSIWRYVTVENSYTAGIFAGYRSLTEYCRLENLYEDCDCSGIQRNGHGTVESTTRYCWKLNGTRNGIRFDSGCGGNNGDIHHVVSLGGKRGFRLKGDYHDVYHLLAYDNRRQDISLPSYKYCGLDFTGDPEQPGNLNSNIHNSIAESSLECNSPDCGDSTGLDPFFLLDTSGIWFGRLLDENYPPAAYPHLELQLPWTVSRARSEEFLLENFGEDPFENSIQNFDFRPKKGSVLIDGGVVIPGINDGQDMDFNHPPLYAGENRAFVGDAPDIGAYEYGDSVYWIPGYRYSYPSVPIPSDGAVGVSMEYGLAFNYPWKTDYSGTAATVTVSGPGINRTESFQYPNNVLFETFLPGETYNWSVIVDGVSSDIWTFTTSDKEYPLNDRSLDTTIVDSMLIPYQIKNLQVSNNNLAFLKFDVPSSINNSCIIHLNLVPEEVETLAGGIVVYKYNYTGWGEKLDENNIGLVDHSLLTPIDTLYTIEAGVPIAVNISDIISSNGVHSFALGVLDSVDNVSFYSKEKLINDGVYPDEYGGYAPQTSVWPSLTFQSADAPVLATIEDQTTNEDTATAVILSATDINGDSFTFTASSADTNVITVVSIDTLTLTPAANWNGQAAITVIVTDNGLGTLSDTISFTFTVNAINDSPVLTAALPDVTIDEDDFGAIIIPALEAHFVDIDEGDILSYTGSALGEGLDSLSFSTDDNFSAMGRMSNYHGARIMTIKRSAIKKHPARKGFSPLQNNRDKSVKQDIMFFNEDSGIIDTGKNRSTSKGALQQTDKDLFDKQFVIIDSDIIDTRKNRSLSRTDSTALIVYPTLNFVGDVEIMIIASDTTGEYAVDTLTLTIENINDSPVLATIADQTTNEDTATAVILSATDIDGDSLIFTASSADTNITTIVIDDTLTITPETNWNGQAAITVIVTDNGLGSLSDTTTFTFTVNAINDTPVLTAALPDVTIDEDDFGAIIIPALEVYFNDVDEGDILAYTGSALGEGLDSLSFSTDDGFSAMGSMSNYHGTKIMTIKRSDLKQRSSSKVFTPQRIDKDKSGRQFTKSFSAVNDIIDTRQNSSLSRTDSTTLIVYPTENFVGYVEIMIIASDTTGEYAVDTLTLTIENINDSPVLATIADTTIDEDGAIEIVLTASDIDEDTLTFSAAADTSAVIVAMSTDTLSVSLVDNWNGSSILMVVVSDGSATDTTSFELTVNAVNDAPSSFALNEQDSVYIAMANFDSDSIVFTWDESADVDEDELTYHFTAELIINGQLTTEYDTTLSNNEMLIDYKSVFDEIYAAQAMLAGIDWDVSVSDGVEEVMAENGPLTVGINASDAVLSIDEELLPEVYALHQNYPNPFNPITTLRYDLPENSLVNIIIYDIMGREVKTLVNTTQDAGFKSVIWNATNDYGKPISAGMYFYKIRAGEFTQTRKMLLLK